MGPPLAADFGPALALGLAVFTRVRTRVGEDGRLTAFRGSDHVARLCRGAAALGLATIDAAAFASAVRGALAGASPGEPEVRVVLRAGDDEDALPELRALAVPIELASPPRAAALVSRVVAHGGSGVARLPVVATLASRQLARMDAHRAGASIALLCDARGCVVSGAFENVFAVHRGRVTTPPLSAPIVAGVTRATVFTLAEEDGVPIAEAELSREALLDADEIFVTSTRDGIVSVASVDGVPLRERCVLAEHLTQRYRGAIRGDDDGHPEWHMLVS